MAEMSDFKRQYFESLKQEEIKELAENAELIESFKSFAQTKGITLKSANFKFLRTIGIVAEFTNIVQHLCPDVVKDKEGLYDFSFLLERYERKFFMPGFLYSDKFMLMAHPYFRRSYHSHNNFAPRFVDEFWLEKQLEVKSYIALDPHRVRINVDDTCYAERDTWYGPKFGKNIADIENGPGKLKPPQDIDDFLIEFFFANAYSLDITWDTKGQLKSFQSEEFKAENTRISRDGKVYHPVRYTHATFDLAKNQIVHFDGAIHFYTADEYYARRDSDFNYNKKNEFQIKTQSEKLFKFNGTLSTESWIEFTSQFMTGNPLVFEYFEGKYPEHVVAMLENERSQRQSES